MKKTELIKQIAQDLGLPVTDLKFQEEDLDRKVKIKPLVVHQDYQANLLFDLQEQLKQARILRQDRSNDYAEICDQIEILQERLDKLIRVTKSDAHFAYNEAKKNVEWLEQTIQQILDHNPTLKRDLNYNSEWDEIPF